MCFAIIVGRLASADGSVIFGHNEQNVGRQLINYRRIPRIHHEPGDTIRLKNGGELPAPAEAYSYLWTEMPGMEFSDNYFNEHGVAIAGDGCPTREDSYEQLVARGEITDGGIGYLLPRLIAMQVRTAREGVALAGQLIDQFGYSATGRSLIIADSREAWVVAIARGKRWLARRVADDQVVVIGNSHVVGEEPDLDNRDHVLHSAGLVEYATQRGWHDPASGRPLSFLSAFRAPANEGIMEQVHGCCARQWHAQGLLTGKHAPLPPGGELPFSVKPKHRLSVQDVAAILRSHLDDTEYDYRRENPAGSPHHPEEIIDYSFARTACNLGTQESAIFHLRSWLPTEIGCVVWRAASVPCTSVYTPWYSSVAETPANFHTPCSVEEQLSLEHHFNPNPAETEINDYHAFWPFYRLTWLVDADYAQLAPAVQERWNAFEAEEFAQAPSVEAKALALMGESPADAIRYLTDYCHERALAAVATVREMVADLGV